MQPALRLPKFHEKAPIRGIAQLPKRVVCGEGIVPFRSIVRGHVFSDRLEDLHLPVVRLMGAVWVWWLTRPAHHHCPIDVERLRVFAYER